MDRVSENAKPATKSLDTMQVEADQTDPFWMLKKLQCELLDTNNETIREDMEERYSHPNLGLPDIYFSLSSHPYPLGFST